MTGKCGAEVRVADQVFVTLSCTLPPDHPDGHYDEIFSRGWGR